MKRGRKLTPPQQPNIDKIIGRLVKRSKKPEAKLFCLAHGHLYDFYLGICLCCGERV